MKHLFSRCTRLHDLLVENEGDEYTVIRNGLNLLPELNLDVSTEEFLSAERGFTYSNLCSLLDDKDMVVWLTPHAAVVNGNGGARHLWNFLEEDYSFYLNADGQAIVALARSIDALSDICDVIRRLLLFETERSEHYELEFRNLGTHGEVFFNAPSLANLMEKCQSLEVVILGNLVSLDEDQLRVLGACSRPGLEIEFRNCQIIDAAASALAQVLGRNQGPTKLGSSNIDYSVVADGLRGNSRLKSLSQRQIFDRADVGTRQFLAIADALPENKGLIDLELYYNFWMSDETWGAVCDSLKTHPTLEILHLRTSLLNCETGHAPAAKIKSRIQAILDMMKVNMSIHTIRVDSRYREHMLFRRSVIPYLETNRLRPRLHAIQKIRPITYRAKVLGRALLVARTDANSFWMLLSGNAEVTFPSRTTTITAAANLPAPATATSTVNDSSVTTSVMPTLPTTAAISAATPAVAPTVAADANVATPSTGQKRKPCP
jgi:hypothetical protein